jgi:hypothetical protein
MRLMVIGGLLLVAARAFRFQSHPIVVIICLFGEPVRGRSIEMVIEWRGGCTRYQG